MGVGIATFFCGMWAALFLVASGLETPWPAEYYGVAFTAHVVWICTLVWKDHTNG